MKFQIVNKSCRNLFQEEKISAQTQEIKNEILHFETFSKLWREIENIFLFQKKKILIEIYFEKFHP